MCWLKNKGWSYYCYELRLVFLRFIKGDTGSSESKASYLGISKFEKSKETLVFEGRISKSLPTDVRWLFFIVVLLPSLGEKWLLWIPELIAPLWRVFMHGVSLSSIATSVMLFSCCFDIYLPEILPIWDIPMSLSRLDSPLILPWLPAGLIVLNTDWLEYLSLIYMLSFALIKSASLFYSTGLSF